MEYRSLKDLASCIHANAYEVPADVDLIVGIPRSGLLAANIMALQLNLPLLDLKSFLLGHEPEVGRTVKSTMGALQRAPRKVLIVDDSITSGKSMIEVRRRVAAERPDADVLYCAIYCTKREHPEIDIGFEIAPMPRMFEWNMMRHKHLENACCDIDGVLCHDPGASENDDGAQYLEFLKSARILHRPSVRVGHLVTSRLEKYRAETEQWLRDHRIEYGKLWMLDLPSAAERRRTGAHASFKAEIYKKSDAILFIESEDNQAMEIADLSNRPVFSVGGQRIVWPQDEGRARSAFARTALKRGHASRSAPAKLIATLLGESGLVMVKKALRRS